MIAPTITPDVAKLATKIANEARHDFCNPRSDGALPSLTAIEMRVGKRIATALQEAFNAGVEASAKEVDGLSWTSNMSCVANRIRALKQPDGAK